MGHLHIPCPVTHCCAFTLVKLSSCNASNHCRLRHCSLLLFNKVTQPAMEWILQQYAAPTYSDAAVAAWQQVLSAVFTLLWLLPLYLISLVVSCIW